MKIKGLLFFVLTSIALTGCRRNFKIRSDFSYNDPKVKIVDNLPKVQNKVAHIAFLYGQSNADGVSYDQYLKTNDLEKFNEYANGYENVLINFVNDGGNNSSKEEFKKASLGCGCATYTYGPEIGMAEMMSKAYPDDQSFIIKWTWGGTSLKNQWLDGKRGRGELYNSAMDFTLKCLAYLENRGYTLSLDGICWMQGESDSWDTNWEVYYNNTNAFVSYLRHDLKEYSENIKFIDAGINEEDNVWPNPKAINKAKQEFAKISDLNIYLDTPSMGLTTKNEPEDNPDRAHYDSMSMVKLGQAFGTALLGE